MDEKPLGKTIIAGDMDISSADIPVNDIEGKRRMGFWSQFAQPILYPAGGTLCARCFGLYILIR